MSWIRCFATASALSIASCFGADSPSFRRDIAPLFADRCGSCHGEEKQKGGYRLDSFERMRTKGESDEVPIAPGAPMESRLFRLLIEKDPDDRMPQKGEPLSAEEVGKVRQWIEAGATFDGENPNQPLAELAGIGHGPAPESYRFPIPIPAAAFLTGGSLAVSGIREVTVWDSEGKLLRRCAGLPERIQAIEVTPDCELLFFAGGLPGRRGEAGMLNLRETGAPAVWARASDMFLALAQSSDGTLIAVAGADRMIRLLKASDGSPIRVFSGHADWVFDLAFSPDNRLLASASRDGTARVFDCSTGDMQTAYRGHEGPVTAVAFQEDGKRVVSAGRDRRIHLWETQDGKDPRRIDGFGGDVVRLRVVGGTLYSASLDGRVREHSIADRKLKREFEPMGQPMLHVTIEGAAGLIAGTAQDSRVRIWRLLDATLAREFVATP